LIADKRAHERIFLENFACSVFQHNRAELWRSVAAVIPPRPKRLTPREFDRELYKAPPDREFLLQAQAIPGNPECG
jgi:hypothetical protein